MKLFRNREIRQWMLMHLFMTAGFAVLCALEILPAPVLMILAGAGYLMLHLLYTGRRYRALDALCASIDRVLHGYQDEWISGNEEGELSVLNSEIRKMTLRLKENADALQRDKRHLVDAIADISHQLRTPLTAMNLTASMLAGETMPDRRRIELVRELRRSLRRIDWLIEALLKLSRIDAGTVCFASEPVSVRQVVGRAVEPMSAVMELKEIQLTVDAAGETFEGDAAWTAEALGNVVKNCVEHTPAGGRIIIHAQETPLYTEIVIRDSGEGFAREDLPHLFDRFYKGTSASAESIGIGLALARTIISRQNGTIQAQNGRDGGAQFTVRFYKCVI